MFFKSKPQPTPSAKEQFINHLDGAISDAIDSRLDLRELCDLLAGREAVLRAKWALTAPLGQAW